MEKRSLGLIETWGFVPAIEAADVGAKAANVILLGYQVVPVGRIVVTFVGDVAAVTAAVSSGAAAARQLGQVLAVHVIPRPDQKIRFASPSPPSTPEGKRTGPEPGLPPPIEGPKPAMEPESVSAPEEKEVTAASEPSELPEDKVAEKGPKSSHRRKKKPAKHEEESPQDDQEDTENTSN